MSASPALAENDDEVAIISAQEVTASREAEATAQLARLIETYDLDRWTFTRSVIIEYRATPHSHPVLTLSTRYINDDDKALSTYLHEQLHWYSEEHSAAVEQVKAELRNLYPDLPTGYPDGARDADSNYLHLIVNTMEYRALAEVIGAERATQVFGRHRHYRRLYDIVEADIEVIEGVMARHGLDHP